jgi:disulfide oxidoreductase YuzD
MNTANVVQMMKAKYKDTSIKVKIADLTGASTNRELDPAQLKMLKKSIVENTLKFPIIINEHGLIIEGHHRVRTYEQLEWPEIDAFVRHGLTEDDIPEFNDMSLNWKLRNYLIARKNTWAMADENIGLAPSNVVTMLEFKKLAKFKTIDPTTSQYYNHYQFFKEKIWLPIHVGVNEKAMRFMPLCLWEVSFMPELDSERLVNQVVKEWKKINSLSKKIDVTEAITDAYNRKGVVDRMEINKKGKLIF